MFVSEYDSCVIADSIGDSVVDDDLYFLANVTRTDAVKVLGFGKGSGIHGRDSRYWDRDDRRRDDDYDEDDVARKGSGSESVSEERNVSREESGKGLDQRGVGLYNEDGMKELRMYEAEYEASLRNRENGGKSRLLEDEDSEERREVVEMDNEYDDGIDFLDARVGEFGDLQNGRADEGLANDVEDGVLSNALDSEIKVGNIENDVEEDSVDLSDKGSSNSKNLDKRNTHSQHVQVVANNQPTTKSRSDPKKKSKRRKFSGEERICFVVHAFMFF